MIITIYTETKLSKLYIYLMNYNYLPNYLYRNIVLIVKDPLVTAKLFTSAFGLTIKHETEQMVELNTHKFQPIEAESSNNSMSMSMSPPIILKVYIYI